MKYEKNGKSGSAYLKLRNVDRIRLVGNHFSKQCYSQHLLVIIICWSNLVSKIEGMMTLIEHAKCHYVDNLLCSVSK